MKTGIRHVLINGGCQSNVEVGYEVWDGLPMLDTVVVDHVPEAIGINVAIATEEH